MKRKFRVYTNRRTLYVVARNTRGVDAVLRRAGTLQPGERIVSVTAFADVPPADAHSSPEQFRVDKRERLRQAKAEQVV